MDCVSDSIDFKNCIILCHSDLTEIYNKNKSVQVLITVFSMNMLSVVI